jgi:hypothetical protein
MKAIAALALLGLFIAPPALAAPAMMAARPPMTKLIGTIASVTPTEVDVTTTDGGKVAVALTSRTRIALSSPMSIDEIKTGSFIGAGATNASSSTTASVGSRLKSRSSLDLNIEIPSKMRGLLPFMGAKHNFQGLNRSFGPLKSLW